MSASFTTEEVRTALGSDLVSETQGSATLFHSVTNDSRIAQAGQLFVALRTEDRDGHAFVAGALSKSVAGVLIEASSEEAKAAVSNSPGAWVYRVHDTTHALGQLAHHHRMRFLHLRVITITGNTGKTSTKELAAAILGKQYEVLKSPANFNNEVGLSMTLLEAHEGHERAVLETGMDRLGEIARMCEIARPDCAVVLNVGPTHLEKLGSMEAIAQAKGEAVEAIGQYGTAVLNADDPYVAAMEARCKGRVLTFGMQPGAFCRATDIRTRGLGGVDFQLNCGGRSVAVHSPLPGESLVYNALAAVCVGVSEGMAVEDAAFALGQAEVPARLQAKASPTGATILDDCYNASPASTTAALGVLGEMLGGRRLALLGDMLELGSEEAAGHAQVGEYAAQVVDGLFTVGRLGALIAAAARASGNRFVRHFDSTDAAIAELRDMLEPGDILLVKASHGMHLERVVEALMTEGAPGMTHAMLAACFAMLATIAVGHPVLSELRRRKLGKGHDEDAPAEYASKVGTPVMGGVIFMVAIVVAALLFAVPRDADTLVPLLAMLAAAAFGTFDDFQTLAGRGKMEAHAPWFWAVKWAVLFAIAAAVFIYLYSELGFEYVVVPHFGAYSLGILYIPVAIAVFIVATSGAAITDGMDGLMAGVSAVAFAAYGGIAMAQGQEGLATFAFIVAAAAAGFLWFNAYPAQVFMGDTGAQALSVGIVVVAFMTGWWLLLPVIGIVFVLEGASDVLQIGYYKLKGTRILRRAPIHYHFQLGGWPETVVVARFWVLGLVGAFAGVALAYVD